MKVLLVNTFDVGNGSAYAAYRLHQGLQDIGLTSELLVQFKFGDDTTVIGPKNKVTKAISSLERSLDNFHLKRSYPQTKGIFSAQGLPIRSHAVSKFNPDIINLHWINDGFWSIERIASIRQPIVWTMHDMWVFTGGCHYSQTCDRYTKTCGACPQLNSSKSNDLSRWVLKRKASSWSRLKLTLVSPSHWLAKCAQSSSLFPDVRVEVIPNGLDIKKYKPINQHLARDLLNLPQDKQLVLFGAVNATSDRRKGFHLLQPALQSLCQSGWSEKIELIVFGLSQPMQTDLGFKTRYLGRLNDDISLALVYAAADLFIAPSLEDNLPNTIMEALACGTPCVAFNIGGIPDLIEHQKNGYLAQPYNTEDLAQGISWVLENAERHQKLSERAREKVEKEFTLEIQAQRYAALFDEIVISNSQFAIRNSQFPYLTHK